MARIIRLPVRAALFILVIALLASCARAPGTDSIPVDPAPARDRWERFTAIAERAASVAGPFRCNATLYYSGKEDSQRVTVYFWGNGQKYAASPLRLDILMGPGSVMAAAREDSQGLFIYVPREETVYRAREQGFAALGVPLPFTLEDLAALVTGRFAAVFAPEAGKIPPAAIGENGAFVYAVPGARLPGFLSVGPDGLPVAWAENLPDDPQNGWNLAIDYWPDSTRTTPRKLYARHPEGGEATLIVRELAFPAAPFSSKQLELTVPPNTRTALLDEGKSQ